MDPGFGVFHPAGAFADSHAMMNDLDLTFHPLTRTSRNQKGFEPLRHGDTENLKLRGSVSPWLVKFFLYTCAPWHRPPEQVYGPVQAKSKYLTSKYLMPACFADFERRLATRPIFRYGIEGS
jgi:hypothetical protein